MANCPERNQRYPGARAGPGLRRAFKNISDSSQCEWIPAATHGMFTVTRRGSAARENEPMTPGTNVSDTFLEQAWELCGRANAEGSDHDRRAAHATRIPEHRGPLSI